MSTGSSIVACGDDALRILCGEGDIRHRLAQELAGDPRWLEIVPGRRDVAVAFDPHAEQMAQAWARLEAALVSDVVLDLATAGTHVFTATFGCADGPDLAALAARLGLSEEAIIAKVEASALVVDMLGFTPGFAYLTGLDETLVSERLANPRTRVAAGSIGLITGQIGLYALDGPGGWPIIGRVLGPLFEPARPDPFVLRPGDRVALKRAPCA